MTDRLRRIGPLAAFVGLCYLPLLLTAPGQVVADTKSYLYLDPDRLLGRAWSMWDPQVGMGTVTHQNIGFLWPMGPYYWAAEHLGVPDWAAQRLWLGSIICAAGLGVRYLLRTFRWTGPAVGVAVCAYALTPYLLTIAMRISAILLPFAALPWLIAFTVRAVRAGGWRHPALFALVVATVGTSNATAILLAGVGPLLWLVWALATGTARPSVVATVVTRIGLLSVATNAWWIAGLSVQATNGVEVLRYTESVRTTAAASSAPEVLRGLGYWFFYGDDAIGPWIGPSRPFMTSTWLLAATFMVPVIALAGGALARWRERSFFVALAVVGLTLAVGVFPYDDPSPFGRLLAAFLHSDVGMAMRSMPRAAPLVILALAVMAGAGVHAVGLRLPRARPMLAATAIGLVVMSLPPLWQGSFVPANLSRPEEIPDYWDQAAAHLDATDDGTRVLEVPGSDFTSYRWGTTVDPVTPGITDREMVARELVPMGSAAAWNLLKAFDGRLQARIAEAATVAPLARTMRAGVVLVRSDLAYEHYDTPRPRDLYRFLRRAPGLGAPTEFGRPVPNVAVDAVPMLDELELSLDPALADPHPVSVFPVSGVHPIVATKPTVAPVVMAGDGEGVVDSAAAGVIDGTELLRYSAAMTDGELRSALDAGAVLIVTDSNRRRGERWGTIRFTSGYTEPAGLRPLRVDRTDARLPVFPEASDDARTVAVHRGGISANATSYGGRNEYLPEDRPSQAVDGDPTTAWRTSRDDPVRGERLLLELDKPVTTDSISFLAPPPPINRWVTQVALRFDGGAPLVVDLDERSHAGTGQTVAIGRRQFSSLDIEILDDTAGRQGRYGGLTSTGFAEVTIGDRRLDEAIRLPVDLLGRAGAATRSHPLAVVVTRLRSAPTDVERLDEERALVRLLSLPEARSFALTGTARLSPRAPDAVLDSLLDPAGGSRTTASSRLAGPASRAAAAFDGDPTTAWVSAYGEQVGQWIEVQADPGTTIDELALTVLADGRHSVPTAVGLEVDGRRVASLRVPDVVDGVRPGSTTRLTLPLREAVTGQRFRLLVDEARTRTTVDWSTRKVRTLPIGIAELGPGELSQPQPTGAFSTGCRRDLLTLDGTAVPVSVAGALPQALDGAPLTITACKDAPLDLAAGERELRSAPGALTGLDIDRLVLRSAAGGGPVEGSALGETLRAGAAPSSTPAASVVSEGPSSVTVRLDGAVPGEPFWLAFGQSLNDGWRATVDGVDLGPPALVDGFANGWTITPQRASMVVSLEFTPQRRVDWALRASAVAALGCLALATRRPRRTALAEVAGMPTPAPAAEPSPPLSVAGTAIVTVVAALGAALLANPGVGVAIGALAVVRARGLGPARLASLAAPAAMAAAGAYVVAVVTRNQIAPGLEWAAEVSRAHPLGWFAVLALATDAAVTAVRGRRHR